MKRFLCLLLAAIAALSLTACGSGLKIATNAEFPPFETMENGKIVGFDVDLINAIAEQMGEEVTWDNMDFDGVVGSVVSGGADMAIAGLTVTESRRQQVDFSEPYYTTSQVLIVPQGDSVFTGTDKATLTAQLAGKKIGVCLGFTGGSFVAGDEDMGWAGVNAASCTEYNSIAQAIIALRSGVIEVIVMDRVPAMSACAIADNSDMLVLDVALTTEDYAIAVKKGNTALLNKINDALRTMKGDGSLAALITKWDIDNAEKG